MSLMIYKLMEIVQEIVVIMEHLNDLMLPKLTVKIL